MECKQSPEGLLGTLRAALRLRVLVHRDHSGGGERRRGSELLGSRGLFLLRVIVSSSGESQLSQGSPDLW